MSVINLSDRRHPVAYTVRITHHWDDSIEVLVEDVADDERSRQSVADALARAANTFGNRTAPMPEEIDQLTRERDEARAEAERLREALTIAVGYVRYCHDAWHLPRDLAEASRDLTKIRAVLNDERAGELEAKP